MALHHAIPGEIVDLSPLGQELGNAKSAALIKSDQFEVIRLIVHEGAEIPSHEVPGSISLHCLEGRVELGLAESSLELAAGGWIYLEGGAAHSIRGIENSSLLLTIHFS